MHHVTTKHLLLVRKLLAQNLRTLRFTRGWSQENLAELSGLHRSQISLLERGQVNIGLDNLEKVATALGLSVGELFLPVDSPAFQALLRYPGKGSRVE